MYKILKLPFKHVIKDHSILPTIQYMVLRTTKIVKHIYYFIKLYTIYCFENGILDVRFTKDNIRYIISLISYITSDIKVKYVDENIKKFYDQIFSKMKIKKVSRNGLTNVLAYETDIIITCIENNIKNNFINHFNKYLNIVCDIKNQVDATKNVEDKKKLWAILRKIKSDILSFKEFESDDIYHDFISKQQTYLPYPLNNCYYFFYKKHDLSKDFFIIVDVISSLAFKKCFTASALVILIFGSFTISSLHNFLAFCFNIPLIKTSNG